MVRPCIAQAVAAFMLLVKTFCMINKVCTVSSLTCERKLTILKHSIAQQTISS